MGHEFKEFDKDHVILPLRVPNNRKRYEARFLVRSYKLTYDPPKSPPEGESPISSEGRFLFLLEEQLQPPNRIRMGWIIVENAAPWMGFLSVSVLSKYRKLMHRDENGRDLPLSERTIIYGSTLWDIPIRQKGYNNLLIPEEILPPEPQWYRGHQWKQSVRDPKRLFVHILREDVLEKFVSHTFKSCGEKIPFHIFESMREDDPRDYFQNPPGEASLNQGLLSFTEEPKPRSSDTDIYLEEEEALRDLLEFEVSNTKRNQGEEDSQEEPNTEGGLEEEDDLREFLKFETSDTTVIQVPLTDPLEEIFTTEGSIQDPSRDSSPKENKSSSVKPFSFDEEPFSQGPVARVNQLLQGLEEASHTTKQALIPLLNQIEVQATVIANLKRELQTLQVNQENLERTNLGIRRLAKLLIFHQGSKEGELKDACEKLTNAYIGKILKQSGIDKTIDSEQKRKIAGNVRREICEKTRQATGIDISKLRDLLKKGLKKGEHVRYVDVAHNVSLLWSYYESTRSLAVGEWRLLEIPE